MDQQASSGDDVQLEPTSRLRQTILPLVRLESAVWKTCLPLLRHKRVSLIRKLADGVGCFDIWIDFLTEADKQATDESSEDTENLILKLVYRIGRILCESIPEKYQQNFPAADNLRDFLDDKIENMLFDDDDDAEDNDSLASFASEESEGETELDKSTEDLVASLLINVDCLHQLVDVLEAGFLRGIGDKEPTRDAVNMAFRPHEPAAAFIRLILDRFPRADLNLARKLGEANWQRMGRLQLTPSPDGHTISEVANTLGIEEESLFKPNATFHDSGIGSSTYQVKAEDAVSLASTASINATSARVPPQPEEAKTGQRFKCQICGRILEGMTTRPQWKSVSTHRLLLRHLRLTCFRFHVFADLQAYVCCRMHCNEGLITFESRQDWMLHDLMSHGERKQANEDCLLCQQKSKSQEEYQRHMARHLEKIALIALPRPEDPEVVESESSNTKPHAEDEKVEEDLKSGSIRSQNDATRSMTFWNRSVENIVRLIPTISLFKKNNNPLETAEANQNESTSQKPIEELGYVIGSYSSHHAIHGGYSGEPWYCGFCLDGPHTGILTLYCPNCGAYHG
ncbi:hypothetical protein FH972_026485 [Carpinus fangiana]|uniref:C2H2-type domain-containing protein n=1 Tax=Carpinus fangiana TaxID=176857 RepID=A0A5N6L479_9ROSI|nr:hypothetical protein FH972_026485 [Carpinus fangiana]